jgi:carbon-monoxide dehydrogenase small subunit
MEKAISFTVNGEKKTITTDAARPLLDVLREDLRLTGTKYGCGEGFCGACTVLMDGKPVQSCGIPVSMAENKTITTIEGLAKGDALHPVQEAFLAEGAMQCGYCTSGMVLRTAALLDRKPNPSAAEIVAALNGNICRCNGYPKIMKAINRAAKLKGGKR